MAKNKRTCQWALVRLDQDRFMGIAQGGGQQRCVIEWPEEAQMAIDDRITGDLAGSGYSQVVNLRTTEAVRIYRHLSQVSLRDALTFLGCSAAR